VYVACNIYPRNSEIPAIADFLAGLETIQPGRRDHRRSRHCGHGP